MENNLPNHNTEYWTRHAHALASQIANLDAICVTIDKRFRMYCRRANLNPTTILDLYR